MGMHMVPGSAFAKERERAYRDLSERIMKRLETELYREECRRSVPKSSGGTGEGIPNQLSHYRSRGLARAKEIVIEEVTRGST